MRRLWMQRLFMRRLSLGLLLLGPRSYAGPQVNPKSIAPDPANYRIAVDVNLVLLPIAVHDRKGRYVPDLRKLDFQVYEGRLPQTIKLFRHEDIPVIAGLLIDHSESMRSKLAQVTTAARTFVQFSNPQDQMFVVNFNETVGLPVSMPFSANANELERAIWRARASGETALYDAVIEGLQCGLFEPDDQDANPKVLRQLAKATGGKAFFPGRLSEVMEICERIARDIRNQYTIGYLSSAARNGAYLAVRVVARSASHGKLVVRTRAGYIADGPLLLEKGEGSK
jgi:Ca-activated chloride channel homolog